MEFLNKLTRVWHENDSLLCVGLDPDMAKLPSQFKGSGTPYFDFNKTTIGATSDLVCAYKPNSAFYEGRGADGIAELKLTCEYLRLHHPEIPIILDFKRGDIGNTNNYYAEFAFDYLGVDAVTVHPWSGREGMQSFLDREDKGIIVWCKGSNEGSTEFQDLETNGKKLFLKVAENVAKNWNENSNCLLVVGATYPDELAEVRQLVGDDITFLVPGIGAQGGDIQAAIKAGLNSTGNGLIVSTSRAVIYADNVRKKAEDLRDEINSYRGGL